MDAVKNPKVRPPWWIETILFLAVMALVGSVCSLFYLYMTVGSGAALGAIVGILFMLMEFMWRKLMESIGERFFKKAPTPT